MQFLNHENIIVKYIFSYQPIKTFTDQNKTFENSKQK